MNRLGLLPMNSLRSFLRFIFQAIASVIASFLGFSVLIGVTVAIVKHANRIEPQPGSILVIDLATEFCDMPIEHESRFLEELTQGGHGKIALNSFTEALERASKDDRIVGLFITGAFSSGPGWATLHEMRVALERFKSSGKPIFSYGVGLQKEEYYLMSVADSFTMHPLGLFFFGGIGQQLPFFGEAANYYGVDIQTVQEGQYKSAIELFTRKDFSPKAREEYTALIDSMWSSICKEIAISRKISTEKLQQLSMQSGLFTPEQALNAHLVDKIQYFDEVLVSLDVVANYDEKEKTFRQIDIVNYVTLAPSPERKNRKRVVVVYAEGKIVQGDNREPIKNLGADEVSSQLRKLRKDEEVAAVVLRVNSPGGDATAASIIGREVELLAREKPIVVSMGDAAASGGYWIAAPATRILADEVTITGSIGAFVIFPSIQKISNDHHVYWDGVTSGPHADMLSMSRPLSLDEMAVLEVNTKVCYDKFVQLVAHFRKLDSAVVDSVAQGRVWSGSQALAHGLIDEIGGLEEAISRAVEIAELPVGGWYVVHEARKQGLMATVRQNIQSQTFSTIPPAFTSVLQMLMESAQKNGLSGAVQMTAPDWLLRP
jgi:protease IV